MVVERTPDHYMSSSEQLERIAEINAEGFGSCVVRPTAMDFDRWPPECAGGCDPATYDFSNNGYLMKERFPEACEAFGIKPTAAPTAAASSAFGNTDDTLKLSQEFNPNDLANG